MKVLFISYDTFSGEFIQHGNKKDTLDYLYGLYPNKIRYNRYIEQELQIVTENTIYLIFYKISKVNINNPAKQEAIADAFYDVMLAE